MRQPFGTPMIVTASALLLLTGCGPSGSGVQDSDTSATTEWSTATSTSSAAATSSTSSSVTASSQSSASETAPSVLPPSDGTEAASSTTASSAATSAGRIDCGSRSGSGETITWTLGGVSCDEGMQALDEFIASPGTQRGDKNGTVGRFSCRILGAAEADESGYHLQCVTADGAGVYEGTA